MKEWTDQIEYHQVYQSTGTGVSNSFRSWDADCEDGCDPDTPVRSPGPSSPYGTQSFGKGALLSSVPSKFHAVHQFKGLGLLLSGFSMFFSEYCPSTTSDWSLLLGRQ